MKDKDREMVPLNLGPLRNGYTWSDKIPKTAVKFKNEITMKEAFHVYPLNDLREHLIETDVDRIGEVLCKCKCKPQVEYFQGEVIVVHNSFDGREGLEMAKSILNQ